MYVVKLPTGFCNYYLTGGPAHLSTDSAIRYAKKYATAHEARRAADKYNREHPAAMSQLEAQVVEIK